MNKKVPVPPMRRARSRISVHCLSLSVADPSPSGYDLIGPIRINNLDPAADPILNFNKIAITS